MQHSIALMSVLQLSGRAFQEAKGHVIHQFFN